MPLQYSRIKLNRNIDAGKISGTTENVDLLKLRLTGFEKNKPIDLYLDSLNTINYTTLSDNDSVFLKREAGQWKLTGKPGLQLKGPHRNGTFKEGFNKRMVYVYGTGGSAEEKQWSINKARFDAESWYYRGNGAFDIVSDKEYSKEKYAGRNVVLIGNASTNAAWKVLLKDCPIQVSAGSIKVGTQRWTGNDIGSYFVWPIAGTTDLTVSVITGTALDGMNAVNANQYFAGGSGFPDIMVFRLGMLKSGIDQVMYTGFFDNAWKLVP